MREDVCGCEPQPSQLFFLDGGFHSLHHLRIQYLLIRVSVDFLRVFPHFFRELFHGLTVSNERAIISQVTAFKLQSHVSVTDD